MYKYNTNFLINKINFFSSFIHHQDPVVSLWYETNNKKTPETKSRGFRIIRVKQSNLT